MNAITVVSLLMKQELYGYMKESILERSLMNANTVASVLGLQEV